MKETQVITVLTRELRTGDLLRFFGYLIPEEKRRALRFRLKRDCDSYVAVHGVLRMILGSHLDLPPEQVPIRYNRFGKPFLNGSFHSLYFSLSHSRDVSVLAFDPDCEIGADIEYVDPAFDFPDIAKSFFTDHENEFINHGSSGDRERFYRLWTRKEALLKAIGTGLSGDIGVDVTGDVILIGDDRESRESFFLSSPAILPGYMVTVATKERIHTGHSLVIGQNVPELIIL